MEEPEESFQKTFTIYPKHLSFLEKINPNTSLALRTVLNSILNGECKRKKLMFIQDMIQYFVYAVIFFLLSYLIESPGVRTACIVFGFFIAGFGIIGGILDALYGSNKVK